MDFSTQLFWAGADKDIHFFQNPTKGPLITVSFDASDGASLAFVPAAGDVKVKVDEAAFSFTLANDDHFQILVEILTNLISNAARYSDPIKEKREIHITVRRTADGTEIEVRDNGIGIPADKLSEIGQFGFRVGEKAVDGSHGYGLWQTQQNLRDLGWGPLQIDSTHGEGSTFRFTIPSRDIQQ